MGDPLGGPAASVLADAEEKSLRCWLEKRGGQQAIAGIEKNSLEKSSTARSGEGREGGCRDEAASCAPVVLSVVLQEIRCWQGDTLAVPFGKEKVRGRCSLCTGQGRVSDSQERWRIGAHGNRRQELAKKQKSSQWKGQEGAAAMRTHPAVHQAGRVDGQENGHLRTRT